MKFLKIYVMLLLGAGPLSKDSMFWVGLQKFAVESSDHDHEMLVSVCDIIPY